MTPGELVSPTELVFLRNNSIAQEPTRPDDVLLVVWAGPNVLVLDARNGHLGWVSTWRLRYLDP